MKTKILSNNKTVMQRKMANRASKARRNARKHARGKLWRML